MTPAALEKLCMGLKGTTQDVKWGADLCYSIGKKMYCVISLESPPRTGFKVTPEEFGELTEREGIIPAPYMAKHHWVLVENNKALSDKEWRALVENSYQMVLEKLPKKFRESLDKPSAKSKRK